jgi:hypothetical protein
MSSNNLSAVVTGEHADSTSSPTRFQLMGGGEKPGEPGKYSPDTPKHVPPKDLGLAPYHPRQRSQEHQCWHRVSPNPARSSQCPRLAGTTSMPVAPCEAPPVAGTPSTGTTTNRCEPEVTTARSPTLIVIGTIKGRHGGIFGRAAD